MHRSWKSLSLVFGAVLCGSLLTAVVMTLPSHLTSGIYADQVTSAGQAKINLDAADDLSAAFRNVAEVLKPSVVSISTHTAAKVIRGGRGKQGQRPPGFGGQLPPGFEDLFRQFDQMPEGQTPESGGVGSGVIARADGYILTNNHVVEGADELLVELSDGRKVEGKIVGTDPSTDLAVVKIEANNLQPVAFGDSDAIRVGDWVLAIGSPFGLDQTVTAGIISGKNRVQGIVGGQDGFEDFLQTDAAINPGNSGGPLVNLRGELVGINTAILSRSGASAGIGFSIPVSLARPVLDSIIDSGSVRRGFLGAQVADVNAEMIKEFDLKTDSGALIRGVVEGQPAAVAGLQPGDVVTRVDGKPVTSGTQLRNLIASKQPGSSVSLSVDRNGASRELTINLQERTKETMALMDGNGANSVMGATLEPLTPKIARELGLAGDATGLVITQIEDGSIAAENGLAVGDIVEQCNGVALTSVEDLKSALKDSKDAGRMSRLTIRRGNVTMLAPIRP